MGCPYTRVPPSYKGALTYTRVPPSYKGAPSFKVHSSCKGALAHGYPLHIRVPLHEGAPFIGCPYTRMPLSYKGALVQWCPFQMRVP